MVDTIFNNIFFTYCYLFSNKDLLGFFNMIPNFNFSHLACIYNLRHVTPDWSHDHVSSDYDAAYKGT